MNLKVCISIDDVHPQKGWRILGDQTEQWLRSLNQKYGAKFTCFVPSNYHDRYPLYKYAAWVKELGSISWLELAAHGHYHQTSDPERFGECEFAEISHWREASYRLDQMYNQWMGSLERIPRGFKPPGWIVSDQFNYAFNFDLDRQRWGESVKKYVSINSVHNRELKWDCRTFFGHDGIHQSVISIHNGDMIMLTSHIAGDWNDNVWNQKNYEQLCLSLDYLTEKYDCEFKTLKECV